MPWGGVPALIVAVSLSGDWLTIRAGALLPSANVTWMAVAPAITWLLVMIRPASLTITPVPRRPPCSVAGDGEPAGAAAAGAFTWISTTDRATAW